jgi:hypothetical protein
MLVVVALKLAEDPEPTLTVPGTVRPALSLLTARLMPPAGTVFDSETVQELLALDPRLFGVQATDVTVTGATNATLVLAEEPL